jgi:hypothetical protein
MEPEMQNTRRKVWIGAGMGAVVAVSLAASLGLSNAGTIDQPPAAISQQGLTDDQQSAAMNAMEQAAEAVEEAMEVGDNIADGCEDVGTPPADAAAAQGMRAEQVGARVLERIRQVRDLIRAGRMNQGMAPVQQAVSAAEAAMAEARQSLDMAQTAVAQNPDARRSSQRMLNGAAEDIDSGAQAMESARGFLGAALGNR